MCGSLLDVSEVFTDVVYHEDSTEEEEEESTEEKDS